MRGLNYLREGFLPTVNSTSILALILLGFTGFSGGLIALWLSYRDIQRSRNHLLLGVAEATLDLYSDVLQISSSELRKTPSGKQLLDWHKQDFNTFPQMIAQVKKASYISPQEISHLEKRYANLVKMQKIKEANEAMAQEHTLEEEVQNLLQTSVAVHERVHELLSDPRVLTTGSLKDLALIESLLQTYDAPRQENRLSLLLSKALIETSEKLIHLYAQQAGETYSSDLPVDNPGSAC